MKDSAEPSRSRYHQRLRRAFHQFRYSVSYIEALPQLTFLGLMAGIAAGLVIALFRLCIEFPLSFLLPAGPESFELLSLARRWRGWPVGVTAAGGQGQPPSGWRA